MIGIVVVSHSARLAQGVKDLAGGMTGGSVAIAAVGGDADGGLGTDVERIQQALEDVYSDEGVLVLMDLGSAVMSAEIAIEALPEEKRRHILLSNAPLVEGTIVASVEASIGRTLAEANRAAEEASTLRKVER